MTDSGMPAGLSLWLLPAESDAAKWQTTIDTLAAQYDSISFSAHVTAATVGLQQAGEERVLDIAISCLHSVASEASTLNLPVLPPSVGDSFFQCVYCEVTTPPVATIGQRFLALLHDAGVRTGNDQVPTQSTQLAHVSLLYACMNSVERSAIAQSAPYPPGPVTFDKLCLVMPGKGQADFSEPAAWQVIAYAELTGKQ